VNGRKRHILVDTLGLVLTVVVHCAGVQDRDGAKLVLARAAAVWTRLLWIWVDGGYAGALVQWAWERCRWFLGVVKRNEKTSGWQLLPHRWVVERTFAWLDRYRRLSKDYEFHPRTSETWVRVAMIHLMVRRLTSSGLS
jgi:putative transposase